MFDVILISMWVVHQAKNSRFMSLVQRFYSCKVLSQAPQYSCACIMYFIHFYPRFVCPFLSQHLSPAIHLHQGIWAWSSIADLSEIIINPHLAESQMPLTPSLDDESLWNFARSMAVTTLRLRQNGCHFADNILKCIFLNENVWIPSEISLKFVPKGPIDNIPTFV